MDLDVVLKRFDQPDEVREFEKGKFELVTLGGMTIGRATYQPGWKWSEHVGTAIGAKVLPASSMSEWWSSGCATAAMDDGRGNRDARRRHVLHSARPRQLGGGDEPYVSLHFMGAGDYAAGHD